MKVEFSIDPGFASLGTIEVNATFIVPLGITNNALTTYKVNGQPVAIRLSSVRSPIVKVETFFHTQDPSIFLSSDLTLMVGNFAYFVPVTIGTLGKIAVVDKQNCCVDKTFFFKTIDISMLGATTDAVNLSYFHDRLLLFNLTTNTMFLGSPLGDGTVISWRVFAVLTPGTVKFFSAQDTLLGMNVNAPGTGYTYRPTSRAYGTLPGPALTAFNLLSEDIVDMNRQQACMMLSTPASQYYLAKISLLPKQPLMISNSFYTNAGVKTLPYDVALNARFVVITGNYDAANVLFTSRWDFISVDTLGN